MDRPDRPSLALKTRKGAVSPATPMGSAKVRKRKGKEKIRAEFPESVTVSIIVLFEGRVCGHLLQ